MVIMGLLIAGIVSGKSIYHAAQLRAAMTDIENNRLAVKNFILHYNQLPGDFNLARRIWPAAALSDGDHNGRIEGEESFWAWQQLALAGMVPGSYLGQGEDVVVGSNVPSSRYGEGSGYQLMWIVGAGGWRDMYGQFWRGNYLLFGKTDTAEPISLKGAVLIPEDAYAIDSKMDNGQPGSGVILADSGEVSSACTENNEYNMKLSSPRCILYIQLQE